MNHKRREYDSDINSTQCLWAAKWTDTILPAHLEERERDREPDPREREREREPERPLLRLRRPSSLSSFTRM